MSQSQLSASPARVLLIGYVWPEPQSSAAGRRQLDWIRFFQSIGAHVHLASQARLESKDPRLNSLGIECHSIAANDSGFDEWIKDLNPKWVVFDRFVTEEQFGWRVQKHSPSTIRILDTQDLHSLRRVRAEWIANSPSSFCSPSGLNDLKPILDSSDDFLREMASIYRSDLTLLISSFEENLLRDAFRLDSLELLTLGFAYRQDEWSDHVAFSQRKNFMFIGNFRHEPNLDAVLTLYKHVWPKLRQRLPEAELEIYGAYPLKEAMSLHDPAGRFYVRGHAPDSIETLSHARVLLAPLRFGAGLKGKITDAWAAGIPVVTTSIGAEGLWDATTGRFGGRVVENVEEMVSAAVALYESDELSRDAVIEGRKILAERCSESSIFACFAEKLLQIEGSRDENRRRNWLGRMITREQMRSTEYFSRWIEAKNRKGG